MSEGTIKLVISIAAAAVFGALAAFGVVTKQQQTALEECTTALVDVFPAAADDDEAEETEEVPSTE